MAFQPCPGIASVELIYGVYGQVCENVFHVSSVDPLTANKLETIATTFSTWYAAYGKQLANNSTSLNKIVVKDLTTQTGAAIEWGAGLPIVGTAGSSNQLPLNVTMVASLGTALRGRSYRGRVYQVGMLASQVSENAGTLEFRTQMRLAYENLIIALAVAATPLVILSRYSNKVERANGIGTEVITVTVDPAMDSQRRRLTGRGQ